MTIFDRTFHLPPSFTSKTFEEQLGELEEFWESENPRVGESGATGWAAWVESGKPEYSSQALPAREPFASAASDPYRRWSQAETHADRVLQPPLRSTDSESEDDPYATVLFSDIRSFLTSLHSIRSKQIFRLIWLSFLGLHVPGLQTSLSSNPSENVDDRWCVTHLASQSYLSSIFPSNSNMHRTTADSHAGVLIGKEEEYTNGFGPVRSWSYRLVGPLDWCGDKSIMWTREDIQGVDQDLVRRIFKHCRLDDDDVEWDILALAFEAVDSVKRSVFDNAFSSF